MFFLIDWYTLFVDLLVDLLKINIFRVKSFGEFHKKIVLQIDFKNGLKV